MSDIDTMTGPERVQYFLTRTLESEEIWGLADTQGWVLHEEEGKSILPLWPYRQFANECIDAVSLEAQSTSLDHFVESILHKLVVQEIQVELWPTPRQRGVLLDATELQATFHSLMESGEYFLEG
jgi:hypothetical protein